MAFGFPSNPSIGDKYTSGSTTYKWNGAAWIRVPDITVTSMTSTGIVSITTGTNSIGTETGALVVSGGVGIGKDVNVGGDVNVSDNLTVRGLSVIPVKSQEFVATAGQTVFTVTDGYVVGTVQVYANGIFFYSNDYTASNGTSVELNDPRLEGDYIKIFYGPGVFAQTQLTTDALAVIENTSGTDHYLTFVNSNNNVASYEAFYSNSNIKYNPGTGKLILSGTTNSVSTTTGVLQVVGGVGIGKDLYVGGTIFGSVSATTNLSAGSPNSLVYQSNTGTTAYLAPGTSGYILQTNGAGSPPSWVPAPTGGSGSSAGFEMQFLLMGA